MYSESDLFPHSASLGSRPWGEEVLLSSVSKRYTLKKMIIYAGEEGGLQYHRKKEESGYLVSGKLLVTYDLGDGNLKEKCINPGEHFHFPQGLIHKETALEDCIIIEASTPFLNDRVRVESCYDMVEKGLPTTIESDIIEI